MIIIIETFKIENKGLCGYAYSPVNGWENDLWWNCERKIWIPQRNILSFQTEDLITVDIIKNYRNLIESLKKQYVIYLVSEPMNNRKIYKAKLK